MSDLNREELARDFAWLVLLAKLPSQEAAQRFAVKEWRRAKAWVAADTEAQGSFLWCCDVYDLEPDAVRRAIKKGLK